MDLKAYFADTRYMICGVGGIIENGCSKMLLFW